jgi:hypothetical protein
MVRNLVTIARCYADLLRFWSTCANKRCRRARHCLDRSGQCWNMRYPRDEPIAWRLRARVRARRRGLPRAMRDWQRRYDPADNLI